MMEDDTKYRQASKRAAAAKAKAERIVACIASVSQLLSNWNRGPSLNLADWPSANEIKAALEEYQLAKAAQQSEWSALPNEDRDGLAPPER